jgi:hypothetical protein
LLGTFHPFDALAEYFAQIFADRLSAALPKAGRNGIARERGTPSAFRFLCEEHLKLPKKKQDEVLAKWAKKNA